MQITRQSPVPLPSQHLINPPNFKGKIRNRKKMLSKLPIIKIKIFYRNEIPGITLK